MDQAAILRNYKELRRKSIAINTRLVESLSGEEMREAASALGILHGKNELVLQTEDELSVMMDYAIYNLFRDGKNAVDRLLEINPFPQDSPEQRLLRAMQKSHFTLFETTQAVLGLGVRGLDGPEKTPIVIVDTGFSQTAHPGLVLATRIYSPEEDWWMTSGTALPLNQEALHRMARGFQNYAQRHGHEPSESQHEAIVRRACIQSGASRQVSYAKIGSRGDQCPAPKIGRNDPCPCGSGKKYKKCCGQAPSKK